MDGESRISNVSVPDSSLGSAEPLSAVELEQIYVRLALLDCIQTSLLRGPMRVPGLDDDRRGTIYRFDFIEQINDLLRHMIGFLKGESANIEVDTSTPEKLWMSFLRWTSKFDGISAQVRKTIDDANRERDLWKDRYVNLVQTMKTS
jgi:hypothetical protein